MSHDRVLLGVCACLPQHLVLYRVPFVRDSVCVYVCVRSHVVFRTVTLLSGFYLARILERCLLRICTGLRQYLEAVRNILVLPIGAE